MVALALGAAALFGRVTGTVPPRESLRRLAADFTQMKFSAPMTVAVAFPFSASKSREHVSRFQRLRILL